MEINTIALDLKVPENGPVKILELMPANIAGSAGYAAATGKNMWDEVIIPFYESFGLPVVTDYKTFHKFYLRPEFRGAFDQTKRIAAPDNTHYTANILLRGWSDTVLVNNGHFLWSATHSKTLQHFMLSENYHDYLPKTFPFLRNFDENKMRSFLEGLDPAGHVIIKPDCEAGGNGVEIFPNAPNTLPTKIKNKVTLNRFNRTAFARAVGKIGYKNPWNDYSGDFGLLQEYIQSRPVEKDGKAYDATMRVFLSLHRENVHKDYKIEFHGAYWKLPKESLDSENEKNSRISFSPANTESLKAALSFRFKDVLFSISGRSDLALSFFYAVNGSVIAAPVEADLQGDIYAQLGSILPGIMKKLADHPSEHHILKNLDDPAATDPALTAITIDLLFSKYFSEKYKQHGLPPVLTKKAFNAYLCSLENNDLAAVKQIFHLYKRARSTADKQPYFGFSFPNYEGAHGDLFEQIDQQHMSEIAKALMGKLQKAMQP